MKALTILQPYAHLIVVTREKPIENRTWYTSYRGTLAIHSGKGRSMLESDDFRRHPTMVFGAIIGTATLVDCKPVERLEGLLASHPHAHGPFCWVLENIEALPEPVYVLGAQGLWEWEP